MTVCWSPRLRSTEPGPRQTGNPARYGGGRDGYAEVRARGSERVPVRVDVEEMAAWHANAGRRSSGPRSTGSGRPGVPHMGSARDAPRMAPVTGTQTPTEVTMATYAPSR